MVKKISRVWILALAAGLLQAPSGPYRSLAPASSREARMEQQKSKWAPNGMKVLNIHGKRRWVNRRSLPQLEKSETVPILKEGI